MMTIGGAAEIGTAAERRKVDEGRLLQLKRRRRRDELPHSSS
jgi:hypothetical protein